MSVILVFCQQHLRGWAVKTHKRGCATKLCCENVNGDEVCRVNAVIRLTPVRKGEVKEKVYVDGFELTYAYKILFNTVTVDKQGNEVHIPWLTDYLQQVT